MDDGQFERLLAEIAESRRHTDERFTESRRHTDEKFAESRRYTDEKFAESLRYTDDVAERLRVEIRQSAEETRREFHVVEESWRSAVQLLAEGIATVDGKVDRLGAELRAELKAESAETRALIRLTCSDLDRRVTRLERDLLPG